MGLIGTIFGAGRAAGRVGEAVGGVAEVFVGNRAERDANASRQVVAAVSQFGAEFAAAGGGGRFDRFINALNRLPRPLMTLGTLGLFVYAMAEPQGFGLRMERLALVPEPLWWLLGAIVSFYFGARELHHQRSRTAVAAAAGEIAAVRPAVAASAGETAAPLLGWPAAAPEARAGDPEFNAAVEEWRRLNA